MFHSQETREFRLENLPSFDEMMISWNGSRPVEGQAGIYARALLDDWTEWLQYGSWESQSQATYHSQAGSVKAYQDAFEVLDGKKATGFHIKVDHPMRLHVYTNGFARSRTVSSYSPVYLQIGGISQMALNHPRRSELCSPASTTAVVRYLSKNGVDPVYFAERVRDHGFDIFAGGRLAFCQCGAFLGACR